MKICIFGSDEDRNTIYSFLSKVPKYDDGKLEIDLYSDYDDLLYNGSKKVYDIVFVTVDSAAGMEGVIAAKKIFPTKPVIWFSDDNDFGTQSYRLNVTYFHTKPITENILEKALKKCFFANQIQYLEIVK